MGPLKMAHLNGLSVSRQPMYSDIKDEPERASNDERVGHQQSPCNENESVQLLGSCKRCRSVHGVISTSMYNHSWALSLKLLVVILSLSLIL